MHKMETTDTLICPHPACRDRYFTRKETEMNEKDKKGHKIYVKKRKTQRNRTEIMLLFLLIFLSIPCI